MGQNTVAQLKKINWFEDLPEDMLAALAQKVSKRILRKEEKLFNKGDEGNSLFVILSGSVKVITHDEDGNEIALNKVGRGEIIGEMALLDYEPRSAGVVALEKTSTLELSREDLMELLKVHPELALSLIRNLSSRLRHNTSYIEKITEMSRRVARGDYSFIGDTEPMKMFPENDQEKIEQLMAEFIAMVRGVREREEELKEQVHKLTLQIDERMRKQEFEEITGTDYYAAVKEQAKIIRAQRMDRN